MRDQTIPGHAWQSGRRQNLQGLTSLRGLAASLVVMVHVWGIQPLPESGATYVIKMFFPLGVAMFFVISAFSLCVSTIPRVGGDGWLSAFAVRRIMRIAPLFYVMALFYLFVVPSIVGGPFPYLFFFQTVTFAFNLMPTSHASLVWAGWAVGVEMLFYVILPFVLVFVGGLWSAIGLVLVANLASMAFVAHYQGPEYPAYFADRSFMGSLGIFAWGILGYFMFERLRHHRHRPAIAMALLAMAVVAVGVLIVTEGWFYPYPLTRALVWAPAFGGIVLSQCLQPVRLLTNGLWSHLGKLSFSLYLCHPPLVYFLYGIYLKIYAAVAVPDLALACCVGLTFVLLYPIAFTTFHLIEQPGIQLGERLIKLRLFRDNAVRRQAPPARPPAVQDEPQDLPAALARADSEVAIPT